MSIKLLQGLGFPPVDGRSGARQLGHRLQVGDLVFIRIGAAPFHQVAQATGTWTNHVGIVLDTSNVDPIIGESRFPWSGTTTLSRFARRSQRRRVAVARLRAPLDEAMRSRLLAAARRRSGVLYDTGFDLHSRRQFCSRYVHEVVAEATGIAVGEVQTFATLLERRPATDLRFWRLWYFGRIPWQRRTITPASLLHSPQVDTVFDGSVADGNWQ